MNHSVIVIILMLAKNDPIKGRTLYFSFKILVSNPKEHNPEAGLKGNFLFFLHREHTTVNDSSSRAIGRKCDLDRAWKS